MQGYDHIHVINCDDDDDGMRYDRIYSVNYNHAECTAWREISHVASCQCECTNDYRTQMYTWLLDKWERKF